MSLKNYNYLSLSQGARYNQRTVSSKSIFFVTNEDIIVKLKDDKMIVTRPTIDYNGKTYKVTKISDSGWNCFTFIGQDLPIGKFEFDTDESNEDMVVIYLKS